MANAMIGGYTFDINPSTASWTYTLKTNSIDTYGGRVIQILYCRIDNLSVSGQLKVSRDSRQWSEMERFEGSMKSIMASHAETHEPVKFRFDALDWEGDVFLTGYSNVEYSPSTSAVSYKLMFVVDSGFATISQDVSDSEKTALGAIKSGVDYVRSVYNTPTVSSWEDVKSALKKAIGDSGNYSTESKSIYEYISELSSGGSSDSDSGDEKVESGSSDSSSDDSYSTDGSSGEMSSTGSWWDNIVNLVNSTIKGTG